MRSFERHAAVGAAIVMSNRWAFEALGLDLRVRDLLLHGGSPLGPPLHEAYGDARTQATIAFVAVFFAGACWAALAIRVRQSAR